MLVGLVAFLIYVIVSGVWAFLIMPYFYDILPRDLFVTIFFFISTFIWIIATYIANITTGEETDFEDTLKEGLIRTVIGLALIAIVAFAFLFVQQFIR